jgi:predicted RNA-binding protein
MYKIPLEDIKDKIVESGKLSLEELNEKVKSKINELSGLISEEGAAHIIANELGVKLVDSSNENMKIKELYAGMKNVSTTCKIIRKYEVREFNSNGREGKVCSLVVGDETETTRLVFWNDQADSVANLKENDVIHLMDISVKENRGGKELHFGDRGSMDVNPAGVTIDNVREEPIFNRTYSRKEISNLENNEQNVELMGTVVQIFDPRFFLVHPETGRRIREGEESGVTPALSYVMNLVLDDGSGNIRCVFWKEQTNNLLGKSESEITQYKDGEVSFEDVKTDLLGEQIKLRGKVKKNDMFERLEFNVQTVEKADAKEELAKLENE